MGAPGARYASVFGLLVTTSKALIFTFSITYDEKIAAEAPAIGDPGYAPASNA